MIFGIIRKSIISKQILVSGVYIVRSAVHSGPELIRAIMKWDTIFRAQFTCGTTKRGWNGERPEIETYNLPVSRSDLLLSPWGGLSFGAFGISYAKKPDGVSSSFLSTYSLRYLNCVPLYGPMPVSREWPKCESQQQTKRGNATLGSFRCKVMCKVSTQHYIIQYKILRFLSRAKEWKWHVPFSFA